MSDSVENASTASDAPEPADDPSPLRAGMVVGGKFALLRRIGEGGAGVVFEAEDTWMGRRVALKMLHAHLSGNDDVVDRFRREARAAAMTNHPNIVAVHEIGKHDGSLYIAQELLEGSTLRAVLDERKRLPAAEVLELLVPVMGALVAAHQKGIVHRDVKPDNVFLCRASDGKIVPKVIDFGVAKIGNHKTRTKGGDLLGTVPYMSPEQVSAQVTADPSMDTWAMGVVLYEALSGECPFEGPSPAVSLAKIVHGDVAPLAKVAPDVPPELARLVHRALARDPAQRLTSMQDLLDGVLAIGKQTDPSLPARHRSSMPPPPGATPTPPPSVERRAPEWSRPMVQPELGWLDGASPSAPHGGRDAEWYAAEASRALHVNALDEAIDHAERAVALGRASVDLRARMRLVQAIAYRWVGRYADAARCAVEVLETTARGETAWYTAIGHLAIVDSHMGNNERLHWIGGELERLEAAGRVGAAHVIAAARLAVPLVRAGLPDEATRRFQSARAHADDSTNEEPMVLAWADVVSGEFAIHRGDPTAYLRHLEAAVPGFAEAGDVRNACLQRANIGNGYMQLGAFAVAKKLLREALSVSEPMRLAIVAAVRANLGLTLLRLGDAPQALRTEREALAQCIQDCHRRFEVVSRIYLAMILQQSGELEEAEAEARNASEAASGSPPVRAYAQAVLADVLLATSRPAAARRAAEAAMASLRAAEGAEEGEALIRLMHVLTLESAGDLVAARAAIAEARGRLRERADRITDPRLRTSFLHHVPENARTLATAARLGG